MKKNLLIIIIINCKMKQTLIIVNLNILKVKNYKINQTKIK